MEQLCSMVMMAIPEWKFRQIACPQCGFNLFARWHQRQWFNRWGDWWNRVSI